MSIVLENATHSFAFPMGDTMARPHHGWSQDPYTSRQSLSSGPQCSTSRIQLPGPSTLFAAAGSTSISSPLRLSSSPNANSIGLPLPAPYRSEYATPPPMGQTPPRMPAPSVDSHSQSQPGPLSLRAAARAAVDLRFSPAHSPVSSVRSDEFDAPLPPRPSQQHPQPYNARYRSRESAAYHHQPPAPTSSPPVAELGHGKAAMPYPIPASRFIHPSSPQVAHAQEPARSMSPRAEPKQMSITSLLSDEPASQPSAKQQSQATSTTKPHMLSPAQSLPSSEYRIRVRQQPLAARSCGFGERDRRVIDPPPIVQLSIDDPEATPDEISMRLRFQFTVLHCSIWNEAGDQDFSAMPEDYRQQRRLMGTLVSSPFVGQDENGKEGCFFCFPDLSCRTPGSFRLKFALVVLDPLSMRPGSSSPIMATVMSDPFTVYNAKDFPGMQASTSLTKRLKEQGCLISIKKGNEKTAAAHARDDSDGEGDSLAKTRKRMRR